jgi:multimeric flavodoxin WrbA
MKAADGIILGSPVYFGSATSQLTSLLDRAAYVQRQTGEYFSGKIGAPIVVARRAGHNFTFAQLEHSNGRLRRQKRYSAGYGRNRYRATLRAIHVICYEETFNKINGYSDEN